MTRQDEGRPPEGGSGPDGQVPSGSGTPRSGTSQSRTSPSGPSRRVALGGAALLGALGTGVAISSWNSRRHPPGVALTGASDGAPGDTSDAGQPGAGAGLPEGGAAATDPTRGPEGTDPTATGPLAGFGITLDAPTVATLDRFRADLDTVRDLGLGWVRFAALATEVVESWGDGSGTVSVDRTGLRMLSEAVDAARERGLGVCLMSVDVWDGRTTSGRTVGRDGVLAAARHYWEHLAGAVADRVSIWQIFNEADAQHYRTQGPVDPLQDHSYLQELAAALGSARATIRTVEPASRITTNLFGYPITDGIDERWRATLASLAEAVDVITLDLYPQTGQETIDLASELAREIASDHAKPLMIGEIGLQTCEGCFTEQEQADAYAAYLEMLPATGAQASFLYELRDGEDEEPESTFGILRADGSPKPAHAVLEQAGA